MTMLTKVKYDISQNVHWSTDAAWLSLPGLVELDLGPRFASIDGMRKLYWMCQSQLWMIVSQLL